MMTLKDEAKMIIHLIQKLKRCNKYIYMPQLQTAANKMNADQSQNEYKTTKTIKKKKIRDVNKEF